METNISNREHFRKILFQLFGELDEELLTLIMTKGKTVALETGEFLFHQGDTDNSLYIVLSGRFRALAKQENGTLHALGDIGEGAPIGEFALFMAEPRSASVVAIRRSIALELKEKDYLEIVGREPAFSTKLTRFVVNRLRRNALQQHLEISARNIAVINLQSQRDISEYTDAIKAQFESLDVRFQILDHDSHASVEQQTLYQALEQH
ncbi:MAG TPA: cyclic nucleotide-binding domain-containing protein, partial [Phnomibacter sp.]|nr:cyclic nucleotide-binding domain-containing protein [Phnomibacter sp.]